MKNNKKETFIKAQISRIVHNELLQFTVVALVVSAALFALYGFSSLFHSGEESVAFFITRGLHLIIVCFLAWTLMRLFRLVGVGLFQKKTKKYVPRYVITLFNWLVIIGAVLFITVSVFGQSAWALVTAGGLIGAGLAFSMKGIVMDMISGLILDVEHTYKTGDWIKLDDNTIGQVLKTTWRHIEVETEYKTLIIIPNGRLAANTYENLSHLQGIYAEHLSLAVDHDVAVERAERVLTDAILGIKEVVDTGIYAVFAEKATEGGIIYTMRYGVRGYDQFRIMRHKVIDAVTAKLHASGMAISETFGQYCLSKAVPYYQAPELPVPDVLKKVSLFSVLTDDELEILSTKATRHLVNVGHELITKDDTTDSLFVIAEGVVDVVIPLTKNETTEDHVVATLGEGNFVGDRSLLLGEPRSATVRARTKVLTYEVSKEDFQPILQARPSLINDLSKIVFDREQDTSKKISDASQTKEEAQSLHDEIIKGMKKFFGL